MNKIEEYSDYFPDPLKQIIKYAPKDNIGWALLIYLFRHKHTSFVYKNTHLGENPALIATATKLSSYFDLDVQEIDERLNMMIWFVNTHTLYGVYLKPVTYYSITDFGTDFLIELTNTFYKQVLGKGFK